MTKLRFLRKMESFTQCILINQQFVNQIIKLSLQCVGTSTSTFRFEDTTYYLCPWVFQSLLPIPMGMQSLSTYGYGQSLLHIPVGMQSLLPLPMGIQSLLPIPMGMQSLLPLPMGIESLLPLPMGIKSLLPLPMGMQSLLPIPMGMQSLPPLRIGTIMITFSIPTGSLLLLLVWVGAVRLAVAATHPASQAVGIFCKKHFEIV